MLYCPIVNVQLFTLQKSTVSRYRLVVSDISLVSVMKLYN